LFFSLPAMSAGASGAADVDKSDSALAQKTRTPAPTYSVQAGLEGEIFPVFAYYASLRKPRERNFGTLAVTITNSSGIALRNRITVSIPGWSDQEIQIVEMGAARVRTLLFAPTFLSRFYRNREIIAATAKVTVTDMGGRALFETTVPLHLRAADDIFWGTQFKYAPFIASWVTPHDERIETLLAAAKEFSPRRRLPGYEPGKSPLLQEQSTYAQAEAIYRALQRSGVSYVNSSRTFGKHEGLSERVRMPRESLQKFSANCIDGAVMYASLFENLGMEPVVVLVPGHAYAGVRVSPGSDQYLYIETSLTGRAKFEAAVSAAARGLERFSEEQIIRIPIASARLSGIYPLPQHGSGAAATAAKIRRAIQ